MNKNKTNQFFAKLQLIAGAISGYPEGARHDCYYALKNETEKRQYIRDLAEKLGGFSLDDIDVDIIYDFAEGDFENENDRWYAWDAMNSFISIVRISPEN